VPWLWHTRQHDLTLVQVVLDNARDAPDELALEMDDERWSWALLATQMRRVAHSLTQRGIGAGNVVVLLGTGSPSYIAAVLGIAATGAVASLVNPHLRGQPLRHAVTVSAARMVVVESPLQSHLDHADCSLASLFDTPAPADWSLPKLSAQADFVYIFTSGTTGLPKPCRVSHARAMMAGASFGPLVMGLGPTDKLYCTSPLYHASGLLIGAGSCIVTRTPMALRPHFSASAFWSDVRRYQATAMLYIGELCRYLVNAPPCADERDNTIRIAVGNGMSADVWERFAQRFDIPAIREFYGATEAPGAIINFSGKVGSVGRMPLRRLLPMMLIRYDAEHGTHVRDERGRCQPCAPGQVGELVVRLPDNPASAITEFRGYTSDEDSERKIIGDVLRSGDRYYRSGDLLRCDEDGFFYFVDRIGDTFRYKGENVSTSEVAAVLGQATDIGELTVVGVRVPGIEGRAGLAALVCPDGFDASGFSRATASLPWYAQPRFVRVLDRLPATATHKIRKTALADEGVDPSHIEDALFVRSGDSYVPLTPARWRAIVSGQLRI